MPRRVVKVHTAEQTPRGDSLHEEISVIQHELELTAEFSDEVERAARQAAGNPRLPELDRSDIPFVTIDPPESRDLDQALHIERDGDGYLVHYAIADVAAFVSPGDAVDEEAHRRGETLYGADSKVPLHPVVLSEGAASLLPDSLRPALLWTIKVDADGEGTDVHVERALVRSRAKLDYESVQHSLDSGEADEVVRLLAEVGRAPQEAGGGARRRLAAAPRAGGRRRRGRRGRWSFRSMLPVEEWNAQISLLTGMAAASLMVYARVGLLRTLPPPENRDVQRLHRTAKALGIDVAGRAALPRLRPVARPRPARPRRDGGRLHPAAARLRLRRLQRRDAGAARAQCARF